MGLSRLEGEALQPSSAGCAGSQLCSKLRCQCCREQGPSASAGTQQQQLCSKDRDHVLILATHVPMGRSVWKCQHTAGEGGAHSSAQAGSPVGAGDADTKALTVLKHSSPPGPLPGIRLQPRGPCPEQMPAPLQPLPPSSLCSQRTRCPAYGRVLRYGVLCSAVVHPWAAGLLQCWRLTVFPSPLLPGGIGKVDSRPRDPQGGAGSVGGTAAGADPGCRGGRGATGQTLAEGSTRSC